MDGEDLSGIEVVGFIIGYQYRDDQIELTQELVEIDLPEICPDVCHFSITKKLIVLQKRNPRQRKSGGINTFFILSNSAGNKYRDRIV